MFHNECELQKHIEGKHSESRQESNTDCDDKSRRSEDTKTFATPIVDEHSNNIEIIQCPQFKSIDIVTMDIHIENNHVELALLGHISTNQSILSKNFEAFKNELIIPFNKIIEGHNAMKKDLVTLRQKNLDSEDKIEKLQNTIEDLKKLFDDKITTKNIYSRLEEPEVPEPRMKPAPAMSFKKRTKYLKKPKVLYIGDPIAQNVSMRNVEKATNTRIRTAKAFSAVEDLKSRFPAKNFTDVTPAALKDTREDDKYTELVLAAPSVDITNINTENLTRDDSIDVFEHSPFLFACLYC